MASVSPRLVVALVLLGSVVGLTGLAQRKAPAAHADGWACCGSSAALPPSGK